MHNEKKNILIFSASHPNRTSGAAIGDVARMFNFDGYNCKLVIKVYDSYEEEFFLNYHSKIGFLYIKYYNIFKRLFFKKVLQRKINPDYGGSYDKQNKSYININHLQKKIKIKPDVILLYFTQGFVYFKDIKKIYDYYNVPIYYLCPDMYPFTGVCAYAWDCKGYTKKCGNCPALYSKSKRDLSFFNLTAKIKFTNKMDIRVITLSDWLLERIEQSTLFKRKQIYKMPPNVTRKEFKPIRFDEKQELRHKQGLPNNAFVISFGANNLAAKRKGIHHIIQAINMFTNYEINKYNIFILMAGNNEPIVKLKTDKYKHLGFLSWNKLAEFYQVSDLIISASIQDTGPSTPVEATLCGIPIISYDTGVAKDWIKNGKTGYIVDVNNIIGLHNKIRLMLNKNPEEIEMMRINSISFAKKKSNMDSYYKSLKNILLH